MRVKNLTHLRTQAAYGRKIAVDMDAQVRKLQDSCKHLWTLHSHYPKLSVAEDEPPQWWSHFVCAKCELAHSEINAVPLCGTCQQLMEPFEDNVRADAALAEAKEKNKYVTHVFLFKCEPCGLTQHLSARIDPKKKKE
jgi:hypothetical protein